METIDIYKTWSIHNNNNNIIIIRYTCIKFTYTYIHTWEVSIGENLQKSPGTSFLSLANCGTVPSTQLDQSGSGLLLTAVTVDCSFTVSLFRVAPGVGWAGGGTISGPLAELEDGDGFSLD